MNLDLDLEAEKWLKANGIEATHDKIYTLSSLLAKVENNAYNDGIRYEATR